MKFCVVLFQVLLPQQRLSMLQHSLEIPQAHLPQRTLRYCLYYFLVQLPDRLHARLLHYVLYLAVRVTVQQLTHLFHVFFVYLVRYFLQIVQYQTLS